MPPPKTRVDAAYGKCFLLPAKLCTLMLVLAYPVGVRSRPMNTSELHNAALIFGGRLGRASTSFTVTPGIFRFQTTPECILSSHCLGGSKTLPVGTMFVPFSFHEENKRNVANRQASCLDTFMCGGGKSGPLSAAWKMAPTEAIVMFGFTPPSMLEWSFDSMIFSRHYDDEDFDETHADNDIFSDPSVRPCPNKSGRCVVLAPMSSIVSSGPHNQVKVGHSTWRGVNNQPVAIIVSASRNVTEVMQRHMRDAGIPDETINVLPIPPVRLGLSKESDLISVTLRMRGSFDAISRASYVKNPPFTVFRVTPNPEFIPGSEQITNDDATEKGGVGRELYPGEAYTWEETTGIDDESAEEGYVAAANAENKETFTDGDYDQESVDLEKIMDILQNELVRAHRKDKGWSTAGGGGGEGLGYSLFNDLVVSSEPSELKVIPPVDGRACLTLRAQCNGRSSNSETATVLRSAQSFTLGHASADSSATSVSETVETVSAVLFGVLHTKTNVTNRMIVSILDAETQEEVLTLDDRAFSRSARRLLMGTVASNLPLYAIKFSLMPSDANACPRIDTNCYTIGNRMRGRPLIVEERTYVPSISGNDFPQSEEVATGESASLAPRLVKPRLMLFENEIGQKQRINVLPDNKLVANLASRGSTLSEADFVGGPGPDGLKMSNEL